MILRRITVTSPSGTQIYKAVEKKVYEEAVDTRYCINILKGTLYLSIPALASFVHSDMELYFIGAYGFAIGWYTGSLNDIYENEMKLGKMKILRIDTLPKEIIMADRELRYNKPCKDVVWFLHQDNTTNKKD